VYFVLTAGSGPDDGDNASLMGCGIISFSGQLAESGEWHPTQSLDVATARGT